MKTRQKVASANPEEITVGEFVCLAEILSLSVFIRVHPWLKIQLPGQG
jgi:hypothetical protein